MLSGSIVPFGYIIFKFILSKIDSPGRQQRGSIVHPCLITQLCERVGVPTRPDDLYPKSTKALDKGIMNLSNVMYVVAHGEPRPPPPPSAFQDMKIAFLESKL